MRQLASLRDSDFGFIDGSLNGYKLRKAARAVTIDDDGRVLMMNVTKHGYYKCPGGGVESGESVELALVREMLEVRFRPIKKPRKDLDCLIGAG